MIVLIKQPTVVCIIFTSQKTAV